MVPCPIKCWKVYVTHLIYGCRLGETCSHVAALLFKVEAAVRLGFTTKVCTELPCVWNDYHIDEVKPARIAEIEFYDKAAKRRLTGDARSPLEESSLADQERFLCALSNVDTNVVGLCAFTDHNERFVCRPPSPKPCLPRPLRELYNADIDTQSVQEEVINLAKSALTLSETEIKLVEEKTRTQSSSVAWHQQRAGRITASLAHDVLHTNVEKPAPSLIKKICASNAVPLSVPAVKWGNDHESSALFAYSEAIGAEFKSEKDIVVAKEVKMTQSGTHTDATVRTCGLFIKLDKQYVGASPDGLVRCLCCGTGVVEVKCPYRYRDVCLDDVVGTKECCLDKDYRLKKDHKYYNQMQFQMGVCDVVFGDFVYWTPNQVVVDRVVRDEFRINEIFDRCTKVWSDAVLKELLTRHLEYAEPGTSKTSDATENVYCICRKAAHGEMIGCDKCDEWFHTECINMKRLPKSNKKWYCAQCKRDKFVKKLKK